MISIWFIKTIFTAKYENGNEEQHNKYKREKEMLGFKKIIVLYNAHSAFATSKWQRKLLFFLGEATSRFRWWKLSFVSRITFWKDKYNLLVNSIPGLEQYWSYGVFFLSKKIQYTPLNSITCSIFLAVKHQMDNIIKSDVKFISRLS